MRQPWQEERKVWSTAMRLDLVRSVVKILDALDYAPDAPHRLRSFRIHLSPLCHAQHELEKCLGLAWGEEIRATAIPELIKQGQQRLEEAVALITMSRDEMAALWRDDYVRANLGTHQRLLDEHSGL